jgi:uncharacterized membrane protein
VNLDLNDWLLALHLLAAFCLIGAEVAFGTMIVALWRSDSPSRIASTMPLARIGTVFVTLGSLGTLIFGVWLAIKLDAYQVTDGWVLAALVLWAAAMGIGQHAGQFYAAGGDRAGELAAEGAASSPELAERFGPSRAFWLHLVSNALIVLLLVDMIWKPGA